jgi:hypothetical protein
MQRRAPCTTVQAWIEQAGITSGPLFRSINRHGQLRPGRLAGVDVARVVKKLAQRVRLDEGKLSELWRDWRTALVHRPAGNGDRLAPEKFPAVLEVRSGNPGRPAVTREVRDLLRRMSRENPLCGAQRIHGELLKLGIDIGETSVSKYMVRHRNPPSQTWRTFLSNHVKSLVPVDFFMVPTIRFQILYVFLVPAHDRRRILHFG